MKIIEYRRGTLTNLDITKKNKKNTTHWYEFGNVVNDGSGDSSVNSLTGDYLGNWNYYDDLQDELIKIPTIKQK